MLVVFESVAFHMARGDRFAAQAAGRHALLLGASQQTSTHLHGAIRTIYICDVLGLSLFLI